MSQITAWGQRCFCSAVIILEGATGARSRGPDVVPACRALRAFPVPWLRRSHQAHRSSTRGPWDQLQQRPSQLAACCWAVISCRANAFGAYPWNGGLETRSLVVQHTDNYCRVNLGGQKGIPWELCLQHWFYNETVAKLLRCLLRFVSIIGTQVITAAWIFQQKRVWTTVAFWLEKC